MLTNNDEIKKLRVAYSLKTEQIGAMFRQAGSSLSDSEITAFLRPVDDKRKRYRTLNNATLLYFLRELLASGLVATEEYSAISLKISNDFG